MIISTGKIETGPYLETLCNFTYEALEWEFSDQEFRRILVPSDLAKSNCSRAEAMWFFDSVHRFFFGLWVMDIMRNCCERSRQQYASDEDITHLEPQLLVVFRFFCSVLQIARHFISRLLA